jgi:ribonuclease Z
LRGKVTILGIGSATPSKERHHSAQYLVCQSTHILLDCGEGTQERITDYGVKFQKITRIFISHLHGDHYLGLMGLITSMNHNNRTKPLWIYAPKGMEEIFKLHCKHAAISLNFELEFVTLHDNEKHDFEFENLQVQAVPVHHRVPCFSFLFKEVHQERTLNLEACKQYNIPIHQYPDLKRGSEGTLQNGGLVANEVLTFDPPPPFSYAYVTDTRYAPEIAKAYKGFSVLYHEATFLHNLLDRAIETGHSTAKQAGMFAAQMGVKQLILGHFSSRYGDLSAHQIEASAEFSNTILAKEGMIFEF